MTQIFRGANTQIRAGLRAQAARRKADAQCLRRAVSVEIYYAARNCLATDACRSRGCGDLTTMQRADGEVDVSPWGSGRPMWRLYARAPLTKRADAAEPVATWRCSPCDACCFDRVRKPPYMGATRRQTSPSTQADDALGKRASPIGQSCATARSPLLLVSYPVCQN